MRQSALLSALVALASLYACLPAVAQNITGSISGVVADKSGSAIAGAGVKLALRSNRRRPGCRHRRLRHLPVQRHSSRRLSTSPCSTPGFKKYAARRHRTHRQPESFAWAPSRSQWATSPSPITVKAEVATSPDAQRRALRHHHLRGGREPDRDESRFRRPGRAAARRRG